ncbi:MAG: hypothetical protein AAFX10_13985, partial [Pseudomonadota bacterium]
MSYDDLSQTNVRQIAAFSPFLDQLVGLVRDMDLEQRSNLIQLERALHGHWSLGQNNILSWTPHANGVLILVVPHYAIAEYTSARREDDMSPRVSSNFVVDLISGDRQLTYEQTQRVSSLLQVDPVFVPQRMPLTGHPV